MRRASFKESIEWFWLAALALSFPLQATGDTLLNEAVDRGGEFNTAAQQGLAPRTSCHVISADKGTSSSSALPKTNSDDFCGHPFESICGPAAIQESTAKLAAGNALRVKVGRGALDDTYAAHTALFNAFGITSAAGVSTEQIVRIATCTPKVPACATYNEDQRRAVRQTFQLRVAERTEAIVGNMEEDTYARSRELLHQGISSAHGGLDNGFSNTQSTLVARVDVAKPKRASDVLKGTSGATISEMRDTCGVDLLEDNAVAIFPRPGDSAKPGVVICPGSLLLQFAAGGSSPDGQHTAVQVYAHEMGHHIDSGHAPDKTFKDFSPCIGTGNWADDRMTEITADFWAAQAVAANLKAIVSTSVGNPKAKLGLLRSAYQSYCSSTDDGTHPSGEYRIKTLLRNNLDIAKQMGCSPAGACTLVGVAK